MGKGFAGEPIHPTVDTDSARSSPTDINGTIVGKGFAGEPIHPTVDTNRIFPHFKMDSNKAPSASATFRKLTKNDLLQTVDQWREKTLHRLGEFSGKWTAWVERDNVPVVPTNRPKPPIKPTSEALMNSLKTQLIRANQLEARRTLNPEETEGLTIDNIPLPSDYDVWVDYEDNKADYLAKCREYERRKKLALESFPDENRKVFSIASQRLRCRI